MTINMQHIAEDTLIAQSKEGDQDAIAELFGRHYSRSLKQATGILRHHDDAQDAVQAAYFLAFRRLDDFRGDASFKTWITRIVVNCCLRQLREAWRHVTWVRLDDQDRVQGLDMLASHTPTPEKTAWSEEIAAAVSIAVEKLPKHLQDAYILSTISELPLQQVASSLGLTVSATKTRLFRDRRIVSPLDHGNHGSSIISRSQTSKRFPSNLKSARMRRALCEECLPRTAITRESNPPGKDEFHLRS